MAQIAVVEDNDAMRAQLCGFIAQYAQESGHQLDVTAFSDGAQLVEPYRPGFDIIFLDIEMPTLGGMPTAERIRRQDPDVVLVFVTNMAQYAIRGYEVDALDFALPHGHGYLVGARQSAEGRKESGCLPLCALQPVLSGQPAPRQGRAG